MKKLSIYCLIFILLASTISINVSVHYCSGEYMGFVVNGFHYVSEAGETMTCCTSDKTQCPNCKHVKHSARLQSQYSQGEVISILPILAQSDWFHGDLPTSILPLDFVEEGGDKTEFYYQSPYHPVTLYEQQSLRAPPTRA